jgi:Spy/CpxP family protein refolding chaperone
MKKINFILLLFLCTFCKAQERPHPSMEEHLKRSQEMLQKELQMNADQQQKVEQAFKTFMMQAEKIHTENPPPPPPPMDPKVKEALDKLAAERDALVKQALTSEQYKKYQELEKRMRPPHPGGVPKRDQQL